MDKLQAIVATGFVVIAGTLTACSSSSTGVTAPPTVTATQTPAGTTYTVSATGGTITPPPVAGVTASITMPGASSGSGTILTITSGATPLPGIPTPTALTRKPKALGPGITTIAIYAISSGANVTFAAFPSFTLTLPSTVNTTGQQFFLGLFDSTKPAQGYTSIAGPFAASGSTLTITGPSSAFSVLAGATYVFVIYGSAAPAPSPSPTPSSTPAGVSPLPSPSPTSIPSPLPSPAATSTPVLTATPTPSPLPSATLPPVTVARPTPTPTPVPSPTATATATATPPPA